VSKFDLGYVGVETDYPLLNCMLPVKKKSTGQGKQGVVAEPLSGEQKLFNKLLSSVRVVVEHTNRGEKVSDFWGGV